MSLVTQQLPSLPDRLRGLGEGGSLSLHRRTALLPVEFFRAMLGCRAEQVYWSIQSGRIRWAFEIGTKPEPSQPTLRIWARELLTPGACGHFEATWVVDAIVGAEGCAVLKAPEVEHVLMVNRSHVLRLFKAGELSGRLVCGHLWITRASLCDFLLRRQVGADDLVGIFPDQSA